MKAYRLLNGCAVHSIYQNNDRTTVVLSEEFDLSNQPEIRTVFDGLSGDVTLDLTGLRYMDSTIIGEIVRLHETFEARKTELLVVLTVGSQVNRIFELMNRAESLEIELVP